MFRLPVSKLEVELRPLPGAEDILLLEAGNNEWELAVALANRLARRGDADSLDAGALPLPMWRPCCWKCDARC